MSNQSNRNRSSRRPAGSEHRTQARQEIEETLAEVRDDVGERTGDLADAVREGATRVWGSVRQAGEEARQGAVDDLAAVRETTRDYVQEGNERLSELGSAAEEQIRARPMAALAVAAGIGFLFGAFWWRR